MKLFKRKNVNINDTSGVKDWWKAAINRTKILKIVIQYRKQIIISLIIIICFLVGLFSNKNMQDYAKGWVNFADTLEVLNP